MWKSAIVIRERARDVLNSGKSRLPYCVSPSLLEYGTRSGSREQWRRVCFYSPHTRRLRSALGSVSEVEIDRWLGQFERLGNHRAVGEHLLQLIDILPLAELGDSLSVDSDFYGAELVVGF